VLSLTRQLDQMNTKTTDPRALILAFPSGASALVYQLVIIRNIRIYTGGTVLAVSTAIIGYLCGIAIGSWLLGRLSDRYANRWRLYAMIEIAIALSVLAWMAAGPTWSYLGSRLTAPFFMLLIGISLLPPTMLMGATLPVLSRCLCPSPLGADVRRLYTWNVVGAATGCFLASWWLIPGPGTRVCVLCAIAANLSVGLYSWWISTTITSRPLSPADAPSTPARLPTGYLFAAGVSGAGFLSAEIAWTRLLVNIASSSTLVIGSVIGGALVGIAIASWLASLRWFSRRPEHLVGRLFLVGSATLLASTFLLDSAASVLARHSSYTVATVVISLSSLVLLFTAFCTLLSLIFPVILQGATYHFQTLGSSVGRLLAINTLGGVLGVALTSLYGIPLLGAAGCLQLFAVIYAILSVPFSPGRTARTCSLVAVLIAVLFIPLGNAQRSGLWIHAGMTHFRHVDEDDILFRHEGREATTSVSRIGSHLALTVNGLIVAETSQADLWDLLLKAHLPLLLHPSPNQVALVGLGAGISLGATTSHADVQTIDCIEISPGVVEAHEFFSHWNGSPASDPRVTIHLADGRNFLGAFPGTYDVITVDPVDPPVCNLYTREFYELARSALRPGGLMVQWVPLFRLAPEHFRSVLATYLVVFPDATLWYDGTSVLLISHATTSLQVDPRSFLKRASRGAVISSLKRIAAPSPSMLLATSLCGPDRLREFTEGATINSDNRPTLEYRVFLSGHEGARSQATNLESILSLATDLPWFRESAGLDFGPRSPRQLRQTLLQLGQARVARLRGDHEAAQWITETVARDEGFTDADLRRLAPFHGAIESSLP